MCYLDLYAFEWSHYSPIEDAWLFIRYEYRASMIMNIKDAWLFHKDMNIELHACFINIELHNWFMRYESWTWLMNVGLHDYLIIICFIKSDLFYYNLHSWTWNCVYHIHCCSYLNWNVINLMSPDFVRLYKNYVGMI